MTLRLKNISFAFTSEKQILKDVSLSLDGQKIYALMGSNGAGKTTLFNLITSFLKLQSGNVFLDEKNITNIQPYKINRLGIGRTFQDLRLITKLTVKENIILAMQNNPGDNWLFAMLPESYHCKANLKFEKTADEIVEKYFLAEVRNSMASEISYGQQKLLSLACCVANGAKLLLIDEAVAGVQPDYRNKIAIIIKQLKEQGKTILIIEHNTDFIADVADKIFFMHDGKISNFENVEALRNDKQVMEAYV